jgi:hypothetical protein
MMEDIAPQDSQTPGATPQTGAIHPSATRLEQQPAESLMFIVGDNYYGKVDHVPGLFYVKTRFLHVWWFPFVPRESYLFFDEKPGWGGLRGVKIPLRWKSVCTAWIRACSLFGCFWLLLAGGILLTRDRVEAPLVAAATLCGLALICAVANWLTHQWTRADPERAIALGELLGMKADEVEKRICQNYRVADESQGAM